MENLVQHVISLHQLSISDVALVGGKNASLGEMIQNLTKLYIKVPQGFATTTATYNAINFRA
jgi:pyruvate, water dikinase